MNGRAVIAYWGPGLSGKSTNLDVVREVLGGRRNVSLDSTQSVEGSHDRVLFDLGEDGSQLELFAPPGQAHNRKLRQEAFGEVDGVVFVADSSSAAVSVNLAALEELELFVALRHQELREIALIFQYNKRDLQDALEVSRLDELLNPSGRPSIEAIATRGIGVFPSLKAIAQELDRCARSAHVPIPSPRLGMVFTEQEVGYPARKPEGMGVEVDARGRGGSAGECGDGGPLRSIPARWSLVIAGGVGALVKEALELGWRIASGPG